MRFKDFLLTEQKDYFAHKINDVLTGIHELLAAKKQMGTKQMVRNAEDVANQIRKIIHASWPRSQHKHLKILQQCGVALMRAIEDKGDLPDVFNSVRSALEALSHRLHVPANKLGTGKENTPKRPEGPPPGEQPAAQGPPMGAAQPPIPPESPQVLPNQ